MTDGAHQPPPLEVAFDPPALRRERMAALRSQRIAAWGWLGLTAVAAVLIVVPLFQSDGGLRWLAAIWVVLLVGMAFVAAKCFVVLARCGSWDDGQQPKIALRLSPEGLWLAGLRQYAWDDIRELRIRSTFGRKYLIVQLKAGVRPDSPTVAGLNELSPPGRRRRLLPPRGPRVLLPTLAISTDELEALVRGAYRRDRLV